MASGGGGGWGHGGGSGWHGGGGSWHGGNGNWHGGGYYWHGGHYGWGGRYWGYPGWSFAIGFNFGPFWGGYGYPYYGYGYAPYYSPYPYYYPYPYPYPYYVPTTPASAPAAYTSAQVSGDSSDNYVVEQSSVPVPEYQSAPAVQNPPAMQSAPAASSPTIRYASYSSTSARNSAATASRNSTNIRPAAYSTQQLPAVRPEVQNVIRALRAMPPAARQRQLDSGRYSNLTPAEIEYVRRAANLPG